MNEDAGGFDFDQIELEVCNEESAGILESAIGNLWCMKAGQEDLLEVGLVRNKILSINFYPCVNSSASDIEC